MDQLLMQVEERSHQSLFFVFDTQMVLNFRSTKRVPHITNIKKFQKLKI